MKYRNKVKTKKMIKKKEIKVKECKKWSQKNKLEK